MTGVASRLRPATRHIVSDARFTSGNFLVDDELLAQHGITDLDRYSVQPGTKNFTPDFFVD